MLEVSCLGVYYKVLFFSTGQCCLDRSCYIDIIISNRHVLSGLGY